MFADYPEYKVHNHSGEQSDEIGSMDADYYNISNTLIHGVLCILVKAVTPMR